MAERLTIQIKDNDNVVVAVHDLPAGTKTESGVVTRDPIPQAHKIALVDIPAGGEVIRYGVVLGCAKAPIPVGAWINEHMLDLPQSPGLDDMPYGTSIVPMEELPDPPRRTWMGYRNKVGPAGTRNLLGIVTTVQCAAGVVKVAVERIKKELLPKYPNVDGVVAITHPYGCGVAINAPLAYIPIRAITNVIRHPNFGGEVMVVGLGCEKLTYDRVLPPEDINPENCLTLQDWKGHDAMMQAILDMAEKKLQKLNLRHREELPLSELLIGMQCGGSDAFSGITANPTIGRFSDMMGQRGGSTVLTEVPEMFGAEGFLMDRCINHDVFVKAEHMINGFKDYFISHNEVVYDNPSPGNKQGGITTLEDKSCGCVQKGGTAPIMDVIGYGDPVVTKGLNMLYGPGNDLVSATAMTAAGAHLILFSTGRGTPFSAPAPTLKISTNTPLAQKKSGWIDFNTGVIADGEKTIDEAAKDLLDLVIRVASGEQTKAEKHGFREISIFKDGVVL